MGGRLRVGRVGEGPSSVVGTCVAVVVVDLDRGCWPVCAPGGIVDDVAGGTFVRPLCARRVRIRRRSIIVVLRRVYAVVVQHIVLHPPRHVSGPAWTITRADRLAVSPNGVVDRA